MKDWNGTILGPPHVSRSFGVTHDDRRRMRGHSTGAILPYRVQRNQGYGGRRPPHVCLSDSRMVLLPNLSDTASSECPGLWSLQLFRRTSRVPDRSRRAACSMVDNNELIILWFDPLLSVLVVFVNCRLYHRRSTFRHVRSFVMSRSSSFIRFPHRLFANRHSHLRRQRTKTESTA